MNDMRQRSVEGSQDVRTVSSTLVKTRIVAVWFVILTIFLGYFVYSTQMDAESRFPFRLGLDLTGGTHLIYQADVSGIPESEVHDAMESLRDVIERRVNLFGVAEPLVQVEQSSVFAEGGTQERLIVELPGVTDVDEAIRMIGQTPLLEFKLYDPDGSLRSSVATTTIATTSPGFDEYWDVGFTGRFIEHAQLDFRSAVGTGAGSEPTVVVNFNSEGTALFAELTRTYTGEQLAIFLDGELLSQPVIQEEISGGAATISGNFDAAEARELVRDLNFGALPVPIVLVNTQSIGASLGEETIEKGVVAGLIGLAIVAVFMILWYRVPGIVSVISLTCYVVLMLALFKLIPITLTAAGVAGFIISIGMAVDANVLIFERLKEELKLGKKLDHAIRDGFARAWLPIRDGNISSILTAIVLYWFGTSIVKGFALTFGLGVMVSMFTAIVVTRAFMLATASAREVKTIRVLYSSGLGWEREPIESESNH